MAATVTIPRPRPARQVLGLIPVRAGSRRLPGKNTRLLAGQPLIMHTLRAAAESRSLHRVIVSTDDTRVASLCRASGAEVIPRPYALASARASAADVALHVLRTLTVGDIPPDVVVLLQPTSPLRTGADIDAAIERFLTHRCHVVISVCEVKHAPRWLFQVRGGHLVPFGRPAERPVARAAGPVYTPNGAIYIIDASTLERNRSFYGGRMVPYVMPADRSVDIDDEADFRLAERLLEAPHP